MQWRLDNKMKAITLEAVQAGVPRWMVLAMPEDVDQIIALSTLEYATPAQRRAARQASAPLSP